jgi:mRNA interferase RelE/StbE
VNDYKVSVARSARKSLDAMDRQECQRIITRLESLARNPRPPGCAKLEGASHLWRIRVGSYRVVYEIDDTARTVDVSIVRHRRDVYRF